MKPPKLIDGLSKAKKIVYGAAVAVATLTGASAAVVTTWEDARPWPTKSEFEVVAGNTFESQYWDQRRELRETRRDIRDAQKQRNPKWERTLQKDEERIRDRLEYLKEMRKRYPKRR